MPICIIALFPKNMSIFSHAYNALKPRRWEEALEIRGPAKLFGLN